MLDYIVNDVADDAETLEVRLMGDGIMTIFQVPEGETGVQSLVLTYNQVEQLAAIAKIHEVVNS